MEDLRRTVLEERADIGIGFDGDADRIGVVDDAGTLLYGDQLLALFAIDLLSRHPGERVIFDVKCSQAVEDVVLRHGGIPVMSSTGHSLLKARLRKEGGLLAGEMSGHIFFAENFYGHDDAVYAAALFGSILARSGSTLSEMRRGLPAYRNSPEIRVPCPDDAKFRVVAETGRRLAEHYPVITIDGVRAGIGSGFGLLRASNTQPVLVLRFEAASDGDLAAIERLFRAELARFPEVATDWETGIGGPATH
jgi:phosphomannomutase/phosphoglucomutase